MDHRDALVDEAGHDAVDFADVARRPGIESRLEHTLANAFADRHGTAADVDVRLNRLALTRIAVQFHALVDIVKEVLLKILDCPVRHAWTRLINAEWPETITADRSDY
jgi:hypothetical protein